MLIGKQVTVIGGGIGGLAAALACARHGAVVAVLERADAITEVGAGLQISPNGWVVLQALGLSDAVAAQATRGRAVRLRDFRRGAEVFAMPLRKPFHFVHRADLIDVLHVACIEAGVQIRLGQHVTGVEAFEHEVQLRLSDGAQEVHGLTIAADGLHSAGRAHLNPRSKPFFTGQVAWRALIPTDDVLPPEAHVFMGPGRHLVRYPLRDGTLTNIVAVEERDAWAPEDWALTDDPRNLRAAFTDFCPEIKDLLADVEVPNLWGLYRHPVAAKWYNGPLALLGDAAHPTLPFLAQGANMALEDAWVLAQSLADIPDMGEALHTYQAARKTRTARIVEAANDNAANYHLRPGPMRFAAHTALRTAARFAPHAVTNRFNWLYQHDVTR
ncbi:FAD-dependent monooxygenase [Jannaschia sp. CCS1]|uniref:FAD-dependent monooxygenase n=1 Tax=Jannaschia sp. (strain CCS1) TaxID=290400 RepID=UPI000053D260|nr:FAD-dependent monooxygenase [Jannaschia sp. CCS1]ABD55597.1 monooxygenase FAD-binding protein [Jannaschia sp. CCS1]